MTTLVTGATGFLGTHLMAELVRRGGAKDLRVLAQRAGEGRAAALAALGVEIATGTITSRDDVARALEGVSRVYHLAGFVSRKPDDRHRMFSVHVDGTRLLCEAARVAGVKRVVLASTSGTVAVSRREDEWPDEGSPAPVDLIGRWAYYASKLYQEEAARRACGDTVELVTVSPSLLLGPGDDRLSSTRDVLNFLAGDIPIVPAGGLNFVDARDVAAVLPVAMDKGRAGERYLLGGWNWTFAEFFGRLERLTKVSGPRIKGRGRWPLLAARAQAALYRGMGRTPPVEPESVEMAECFWYFESTKAATELGFAARDATDTLHDTVTYLRDHFLGRKPLVQVTVSAG